MTTDVYAPCPCGSGKKLKFCCHAIAGEMTRITRLRENHQVLQALQALEELEKQHPDNPWILTTRATMLLSEGEAEEAKAILDRLLETHPDHTFVLGLAAVVSQLVDGFDKSRPLIHKAFQRCVRTMPDIVANIAVGISAEMLAAGKLMAARQHMAMAMRFAHEEDQENIFLRLMRFDSNEEFPYPLRGPHPLAPYTPPDDERRKEYEKAVRLANLGCWALSARIFAGLAEQEPENAALRKNAGLCHAWDGNESAAAEALRRAAELEDDFPAAVESETLAGLLQPDSDDDAVRVRSTDYDVESVGRLLSTLDGHERLVRLESAPEEEDEDDDEHFRHPAAMYNLLDRPPADETGETLTPETVPNVIAEISVFDHDPLSEQTARLFAIAKEGDDLDQTRRLLEEVAGGEIQPAETEGETVESFPRDFAALHWRWYLPESVPVKTRRELIRQQWTRLIDETWPNTKLSILEGKSPLEAAGDPELKRPLAAAVILLDTVTEQQGYVLDTHRLIERLGIEPFPPLEVTPETPLHSLSVIGLRRLPLTELSDDQLLATLNRALLIHHSRFLYDLLKELLGRPGCADKIDAGRAYFTLADLCREQHRRDEALQWIARGTEHAGTQENAFEEVLQWKLREVTLRLEEPDDPELPSLLKHLWEYYGPKVPQLRTYLATITQTYGITPPWDDEDEIVSPEDSGKGIWTPEGTAESGQQPKSKLWLPGQE